MVKTVPQPQPPPDPNWREYFNETKLRPTCIKIINAEDNEKSITLYDAELFEGVNDSDQHIHLTKPQTEINLTHVNIMDISTNINLHHQQNIKNNIFSIKDLMTPVDHGKILQMRINIDKKQMDSGANKNVTDDKSILYLCMELKKMKSHAK